LQARRKNPKKKKEAGTRQGKKNHAHKAPKAEGKGRKKRCVFSCAQRGERCFSGSRVGRKTGKRGKTKDWTQKRRGQNNGKRINPCGKNTGKNMDWEGGTPSPTETPRTLIVPRGEKEEGTPVILREAVVKNHVKKKRNPRHLIWAKTAKLIERDRIMLKTKKWPPFRGERSACVGPSRGRWVRKGKKGKLFFRGRAFKSPSCCETAEKKPPLSGNWGKKKGGVFFFSYGPN